MKQTERNNSIDLLTIAHDATKKRNYLQNIITDS
ncbi:hypothetical protein AsAng_0009100 [Aureispira anguillae]|uniref:Uncharacterized protein n=1 Tax=Aureispira anguillae TaxID=2864201 RepID=A0A915YBU3_9BACT|nr:hypothetical protein AsAng_0009100 [Aureispira anguillae]